MITANSLDSMEGVNGAIELNNDGSVHTYMLRLPMKERSFRCDCGCNCFHKRVGEPNRYICNACDAEYTAS